MPRATQKTLHDLILRANRALGAAFSTIRRCVCLFFWCIYKAWKPTLEVGAFVGIAYLALDTYFQTEATVSSVASDPKDPLFFPFSITNNSHLFWLNNIKWACVFKEMRTVNGPNITFQGTNAGLAVTFEGDNLIPPGNIINISCKRALGVNSPITRLAMDIELKYSTSVFGFPIPRGPITTHFTWGADASSPQWIKGEIIK
jgi:hypothetical protein